jgi:hypothetical protein
VGDVRTLVEWAQSDNLLSFAAEWRVHGVKYLVGS